MNICKAVQLARNKEAQGMEFLYRTTYPKAFRIALGYMKQEDAAFDVLQDAYLTAFDSLKQLKKSERFESWFFRIVVTKAIDEIRKQRVILFSEIEEETGNCIEELLLEHRWEAQPEVFIDRMETSYFIDEIIDKLPREQELCIRMFYENQMSIEEIAKHLGVSKNTIKSRLNYGRRKIKLHIMDKDI